MSELNTSILTIEQKAEALISESVKSTPGATEADLQKLTPRGQEIVAKARHAARKMFAKSGDKTWLKVGKAVGDRWGHKKKPAPLCETK